MQRMYALDGDEKFGTAAQKSLDYISGFIEDDGLRFGNYGVALSYQLSPRLLL